MEYEKGIFPTRGIPVGAVVTASGTGAEMNAGGVITYEEKNWKGGKLTDFQAHQIEHQLSAYTDCNHGQGLAVIHPAYYRHIVNDAPEKFIRFAKTVFDKSTATDGLLALEDFIKECGLPTKMSQLYSKVEITAELLRKVADTSNIVKTGPRELTKEEIYEILMECI